MARYYKFTGRHAPFFIEYAHLLRLTKRVHDDGADYENVCPSCAPILDNQLRHLPSDNMVYLHDTNVTFLFEDDTET